MPSPMKKDRGQETDTDAEDQVYEATRISTVPPEPLFPSTRHSVTSGHSSVGWAVSDSECSSKDRFWSSLCQYHAAHMTLKTAFDAHEARLQTMIDSAFEVLGKSRSELPSFGVEESHPSLPPQAQDRSFNSGATHRAPQNYDSEDSSARGMGDVVLLEFWQRSEARVSHVRSALSSNGSSELPRSFTIHFTIEDIGKAGDVMLGSTCLSRMVFHPNATLRMAWDILSAVAIIYDIITVPLMVFGYDSTPLSAAVSTASTCFWMTDLIFTFFVGFYREDGGIEMRLRAIASRYIRTWFLLDVSMILADVIIFLLDTLEMYGSAGAIRVSKTLRTARIVRFLRVLRLTRVFRVMARIEEFAGIALAASCNAFFNISKLMIGVAVFAHFIACTWYEIGKESDAGWVAVLVARDESLFYQYICAYHWTMAQFTPAPTDFHPANCAERTFAVLVLFIGFVIFSSLLGSTAALISQARDKVFQRMKEMETLRRFFVENRISLDLASRITSLAKNDARGRRRIKESNISLLKILPQSVQVELRLQVHGPQVADWTIFALVRQNSESALADLCHVSISELDVAANEEIFHFGSKAVHMIYILKGPMIYGPGPLPLTSDASIRSVLHDKTPLAEACLWSSWHYKGQLTSNGHCEILKVDADIFRRVSRKHLVFRVLREFGLEWVRQAQLEDIDDTFCSFASLEEYASATGNKLSVGECPSLRRADESYAVTAATSSRTPYIFTLEPDSVIDEEVEKSV